APHAASASMPSASTGQPAPASYGAAGQAGSYGSTTQAAPTTYGGVAPVSAAPASGAPGYGRR
ncbi:MAG: hypothetical protein WCA46_18525, partial [Actinocatenispora sp.]